MKIGSHLRAARIAARMTQEDAAYWCEVERSQISNLETGRHEPRIATLRKLADAYGTTVSALIGEVPPPVQALTAQERAVLAALRNHRE